MPGEVLSVERTGYSEFRRAVLYRLKVRCPQCHEVSVYKNYHQKMPGYFKQACQHCNQRFDLSPEIFPHLEPHLAQFRANRDKMIFEDRSLHAVRIGDIPFAAPAEADCAAAG